MVTSNSTPQPRRWLLASCLLIGLFGASSCGSTPSGVITNPAVSGAGSGPGQSSSAAGSTTPQQSGVRTVLSPLGLNVRADGASTATRLAAAAQSAQLTVLGYSAQNGGWYKIQGATTTGWISADPALSAAGSFIPYNSSEHAFGLLYPSTWTFSEATGAVVFRPQSGDDSMVARSMATPPDGSDTGGFQQSQDSQVVVCGVTGDLLTYVRTATPVQTLSAAAPYLTKLATIKLKLDGTHYLAMDFNYNDAAALTTFADLYNSVTFPFPQCQAPASPVPSPS